MLDKEQEDFILDEYIDKKKDEEDRQNERDKFTAEDLDEEE